MPTRNVKSKQLSFPSSEDFIKDVDNVKMETSIDLKDVDAEGKKDEKYDLRTERIIEELIQSSQKQGTHNSSKIRKPTRSDSPLFSRKSNALEKDKSSYWIYDFELRPQCSADDRIKHVNVSHELKKKASELTSPFSLSRLKEQEEKLKKLRCGGYFVEKIVEPEHKIKKRECFPPLSKFQTSNMSRRISTGDFSSNEASEILRKVEMEINRPSKEELDKNTKLNETPNIFGEEKNKLSQLESMFRGNRKTILVKGEEKIQEVEGLLAPSEKKGCRVVRVKVKAWGDLLNISKIKGTKQWERVLVKRQRDKEELMSQKEQLAFIANRALQEAEMWNRSRRMHMHKSNELWGIPRKMYEREKEKYERLKLFYNQLLTYCVKCGYSEIANEALKLLKSYLLLGWDLDSKLFFTIIDQIGYPKFYKDHSSQIVLQKLKKDTGVTDEQFEDYRIKVDHKGRLAVLRFLYQHNVPFAAKELKELTNSRSKSSIDISPTYQ